MLDYDPVRTTSAADVPASWTIEQRELNELLLRAAEEFASHCQASPGRRFPLDSCRVPKLLYNRGLGEDEAQSFLRARRHGLVEIHRHSNFQITNARACSPNLHLLSRNGDHFRVNLEVLVHVGAYAELVLDRGWKPERIVFDPFFGKDALDLWGFADRVSSRKKWREGRIIFVAEAKARVDGTDGLTNLLSTFKDLQKNPASETGTDNHRRKWSELVRIVQEHGTVEVLLAADGARWWFEARANGVSIGLNRIS